MKISPTSAPLAVLIAGLVLAIVFITCGGDFDEDAGRYPNNVAEPAA